VFHDPTTFAEGFPRDVPRWRTTPSRTTIILWERGHWVAPGTPTSSVPSATRHFSSAPTPFIDAEMSDEMSELLVSLDPPVHKAAQTHQPGFTPARRQLEDGVRTR
jgi:hypothetical protein